MLFQIEVSGDAAAALGDIIAGDGYKDPQQWLFDYITTRLSSHLLNDRHTVAAVEYGAAVAAAQATQAASLKTAAAEVAAAVADCVTVTATPDPAAADATPAVAKG